MEQEHLTTRQYIHDSGLKNAPSQGLPYSVAVDRTYNNAATSTAEGVLPIGVWKLGTLLRLCMHKTHVVF